MPALQRQEPALAKFLGVRAAPQNPNQTPCSHRTTMSSYAHLSDPDPEFAAYLEQHPHTPLSPPDDIAAAQRGWIEHAQPRMTAIEKGRMRPGQ